MMLRVKSGFLSVLRAQFQRVFRFGYSVLLEPHSLAEDAKRRELLVNATLCATLVLTATCMFIVLGETIALDTYHGIPFWVVAIIFSFLSSLLFLSRKGYFRFTAIAIVVILLTPTFYAAARWGIDLPLVILMDAFLILMTSVLFGTGVAFGLGILLSSMLLGIAWLETHGLIEVNRYWRLEPFVFTDGFVISVALFVITSMTWLANREIAKSLLRERKTRKALQVERDRLEERVEERTEQIRRLHQDQLEQMHRFVEFGQMAAGFFHDITSPLTAISMDLEALKEKKTKQQAEEYLDRARRVTGRIEHYLADVQRCIREESTPTEFHVREILESANDLLSHKRKQQEVLVEVVCDQSLRLFGDAVKLQQVVANLLSNAIDSYEGETSHDRRVVMNAEAKDNGVKLTVRDFGVGIREDILPKIWDPFFTERTGRTGTGIGLTITKKIVEQDFGGTISCESEIGKGTTFNLFLKQYEQKA